MKFEKVSFKTFYESCKNSDSFHSLAFRRGIQTEEDQEKTAYKLWNEIKLPKRATKFSAGYDFFTPIEFGLGGAGTLSRSITIPTGIKVDLDNDKFLMMVPRSGQGFRNRLMLWNTCGIIDSDYFNNEKTEGHIMIKFYLGDPSNRYLRVDSGEAVCQGIIVPYFKVSNDEVEEARKGGFGSTSK